MELKESELLENCYEIAKATLWVQGLRDAGEIKVLAEQFYSIAMDYCDSIREEKLDCNVIVRAVGYLQIHAIPPMRNDTLWFSSMLEVLIGLACPNWNGPPDAFYSDIEEGRRRLTE